MSDEWDGGSTARIDICNIGVDIKLITYGIPHGTPQRINPAKVFARWWGKALSLYFDSLSISNYFHDIYIYITSEQLTPTIFDNKK